jgi:hypothetical protein
MKYLNTKPGSIEEIAANMSKHQNESGYQDMFKKELEKAGKGIGSMTPAEKKAFFNKIDDKYKAKNEDIKEEVSQKDVDKFHTKLDKLVHKSFGHSSDEKKKEVKEEDAYDKDDEKPKSKPKKEAVDNPYAVGMAAAMKAKDDKPPLKKSTITKAHDIAKSIKKDEKNEEAKYPHKMYSKDGKEVEAKTPEDHKKYADMGYTHKNETHSFMTKDMNKSKKDAKGEKEIVDPEPKLKQESLQDAIKSVWQLSAEELEKMKSEAKYMKAQRMNQYKAEDEKNKKGTADTGSKATKVDVEPSVDYKN